MSQPDSFLGSWLVTEYIYNNDGSFAGIVRQKRRLHRLESGHIRVTQFPEPGPQLASHAMGLFTGERVFNLEVVGRARRYLGPDVIGTGLEWGAGAMTGRGVWPHFGHNFESFAVTPSPERQITGGKFFNATELVANICGLAVLEQDGAVYPEFVGPQWAGEASKFWVGNKTVVRDSGTVASEESLMREYDGSQWYEGERAVSVQLQMDGSRFRVGGSWRGVGKQFGWMFEYRLVAEPGVLIEMMEVLDNGGRNLIGLRRWWRDEVLEKVEVLRLKPSLSKH